MAIEYTPGAERALAEASLWTSAESAELALPEILLGLLAEPECRAALILARFGVDAPAVRTRFPQLAPVGPDALLRSARSSRRWSQCLQVIEDLLAGYPRPLTLATEHLLLAVAAVPGEVSAWLAEQGLGADGLEAEVHRLSGYEPGPLPLDFDTTQPTAQHSDQGELAVNDQSQESFSPFESGSLSPDQRVAALRIIDAAANRAGEALRVIEDYLRLGLDDRHLTALAKSLRHDLTAVLAAYSASDRHAARETQADVGTRISLDSEMARSGLGDVIAASFKRLEQSLRSLEEFSKALNPSAATALEQLRYRTYTLERAAGITQDSADRLRDARLYVLIDAQESPARFNELVSTLVSAGVSVIQLRDKHLHDRVLLERARALRALTHDTQTLFILNDRPDLALLSGADGVHVGQDELTVKDARRILGPSGLIGVSTHSIEQARAAVLDGASYIGVGPTFPSDTKRFAEFTGLELLAAVGAEISLPAFAIGGITVRNLPSVLEAGITRVAVSGAISTAENPEQAVAELWELLRSR